MILVNGDLRLLVPLKRGETYDSNIAKEAEEELGLKVINPEKLYKERIRREYNYFCQWYRFLFNGSLSELRVNKEEVEEVKWFSREDLLGRVRDNPHEFTGSGGLWVERLSRLE